jgi:excisionase family DNA binding protein
LPSTVAKQQTLASQHGISPQSLPMRIKTVALMFDVSVKTIRRLIERGILRSFKLGGLRMVWTSDAQTYLDGLRDGSRKELA